MRYLNPKALLKVTKKIEKDGCIIIPMYEGVMVWHKDGRETDLWCKDMDVWHKGFYKQHR